MTRDYRTAKDLFGDGVPEKAPPLRRVVPPRPPPLKRKRSAPRVNAGRPIIVKTHSAGQHIKNRPSARQLRIAARLWQL